MSQIKVWGVAGSLRENSWNKQLLEATASLAPEDFDVRITTLLPEIPLFNEDLIGNEPDVVVALREEVAAADAVMIATPEYNGMPPGVLKNMLDWIAFPLGTCVLMRKPVALIGASGSKLGSARAQSNLRNMFMFTQSLVVPSPEVLVNFAYEAFDENGALKDPVYHSRIAHVYSTLRTYASLNEKEVSLT